MFDVSARHKVVVARIAASREHKNIYGFLANEYTYQDQIY